MPEAIDVPQMTMEWKCKHCGGLVFDEDFRRTLDNIRGDCGFPLPVTSGYRCPDHPIEVAKDSPGAHCSGKAVDIRVSGEKAHRLLEVAFAPRYQKNCVNQKGDHGKSLYIWMMTVTCQALRFGVIDVCP